MTNNIVKTRTIILTNALNAALMRLNQEILMSIALTAEWKEIHSISTRASYRPIPIRELATLGGWVRQLDLRITGTYGG